MSNTSLSSFLRIVGMIVGIMVGLGTSLPAANAVVITSGCANPVQCTIAELVAGGTIQVNDKLFENWFFSSSATGTGTPANPSNIFVRGLDDGGLDPGPGIQINPTSEWSVTGDGNSDGTQMTIFNYFVRVLDSGLVVKDSSLFIGTEDRGGDSRIITLFRELDSTLIDVMSCQNVISAATPCDTADFAPQTNFRILNQIDITAPASPVGAGVDVVGVITRLSQQSVPEPGTLALFAFGLAGLGVARRRRVNA